MIAEFREVKASDFRIGQRVLGPGDSGAAEIVELNADNEVVLRYESDTMAEDGTEKDDESNGYYDRLSCSEIVPIQEPPRSLQSISREEWRHLFEVAFGYVPDPCRIGGVKGSPRITERFQVHNSHHHLMIMADGNMMAYRDHHEQTHCGFNAVKVLDYLQRLNVQFDVSHEA